MLLGKQFPSETMKKKPMNWKPIEHKSKGKPCQLRSFRSHREKTKVKTIFITIIRAWTNLKWGWLWNTDLSWERARGGLMKILW